MALHPVSQPNERLIGRKDARKHLATPALILEIEPFERNIARMAAFSSKAGVKLRPHAKTHKSVEIARRQLAAGAIGQCCAKLGEAEVFAAHGLENLLITSPIVDRSAVGRLAQLNRTSHGLLVTIGDIVAVEALSAAAVESGRPLGVLVDLDIGLARTGTKPGDPALSLAQAVRAQPHLRLLGLQAYGGHLQHIEDFEERRTKNLRALESVAATKALLNAHGIDCPIVSGGGTGTCAIDVEANLFTELQVGSYVFMDREYNDVRATRGQSLGFDTALFIDTAVIHRAAPGLATTDAGLKSMATEAGPPPIVRGAPTGAKYFFFGDEQGGVLFDATQPGPQLGDRITCVTPHCDPTVNMHDVYHVMRDNELVALWSVTARGRGA